MMIMMMVVMGLPLQGHNPKDGVTRKTATTQMMRPSIWMWVLLLPPCDAKRYYYYYYYYYDHYYYYYFVIIVSNRAAPTSRSVAGRRSRRSSTIMTMMALLVHSARSHIHSARSVGGVVQS